MRPLTRGMFVLVLAALLVTVFYALTAERHCPPEKPVRVEDGSCVPSSFFEGTVLKREGGK